MTKFAFCCNTAATFIFGLLIIALSPAQILIFQGNASDKRIERLQILYPQSESHEVGQGFRADIVAVHGLGSTPGKTWSSCTAINNNANQTNSLWLRDLLPEEGLEARIMAFNHKSIWKAHASSKTLEDHADDLLRILETKRQGEKKHRPIIFLGHSFGGIIIKQAIVNATKYPIDDFRHKLIECTKGCIFLGTPHKGSPIVVLAQLLALLRYWQGSSTDLLESISVSSQANKILHNDFMRWVTTTGRSDSVCCVFEACQDRFLGFSLRHVVDKDSATIDGLEKIGFEETHRQLQRFSSREDANYQELVSWLRRTLDKTPSGVRDALNQSMDDKPSYQPARTFPSHTMLIIDSSSSIPPKLKMGAPQWSDTHSSESLKADVSGLHKRAQTRAKSVRVSVDTEELFHSCTESHHATDPRRHEDTLSQQEQVSNFLEFLNPGRDQQDFEEKTMLAAGKDPYEKHIRDKAPQTCRWILEKPQFVQWRGGSGTAPLLLLGESGQGKSVLTKSLISDFARNNSSTDPLIVLGFFCKSGHEDRDNPISVVQSLLYRLLLRNPENFKYVVDVTGPHMDLTKGLSLESLWAICMKILVEGASRDSYILIDGIDECDESAQKKMLEMIKNASGNGAAGRTTVRILITSQPTAVVSREARDLSKIEIHLEDIVEDILCFIESRVTSLALDEAQATRVRDLVQQKLVDGAQGTFLLSSFVFEELDGLGEEITIKKVLSVLEHIPRGLKDYYMRVLQRIPQERQEAAGRILGILISAQRPLTDSELAVAFLYASRPTNYVKHLDMEGELLLHMSGYSKRVCTSLVKVTGRHIEIVHQSARTFLLELSSDGEFASLAHFQYNPVGYHILMSKTCLKYLLLSDFNQAQGDFESADQYPFLAYASHYWSYHVRGCKENIDEITTLLTDFLNRECPNFTFWYKNLKSKSTSDLVGLYAETIPQSAPSVLQTLVEHGLLNVLKKSNVGAQHVVGPIFSLDINERDISGKTALQTAIQNYAKNNDMLHNLLKLGADPNLPSDDGFTPLHHAVVQGYIPAIDDLCAAGASLEARCRDDTPLYLAVALEDASIVAHLLQKGANPMCTKSGNWGTLHKASYSGNIEVAHALLGAFRNNLDPRTEDGLTPLHLTAESGHLAMAQYLHENGAVLDVQSKDGHTPLHRAALFGHLEFVKWLIQLKADVHCTSNEGWTPLHLAVVSGNLTMAKYLHENGAVLDVQSKDGYTPLHHAALFGHLEFVKWLVQLKADVHCTSNEGWTPLHLAAVSGNLTMAQYLHENGAVLDGQLRDGYTPLHHAALFGHLEFVKWLIQLKADVHCASSEGWTPLHLAVESGHLAVAQYLHENGAVLDVQSKDGYTPLHHATGFGQLEIIKWLIQLKADVHCASSEGWTPLHLAAVSGNLAVAQYLHEQGAVLDVQSKDGSTPLYLASQNGNLDVVNWLVQLNADVHCTSNKGWTPLHAATQEGFPAIAKLLHSRGSSLATRTDTGYNALHLASSSGNLELVQWVLDRDDNVLSTSSNGGTPLHIAAEFGYLEIAKQLYIRGAAIEARTKNGFTPIYHAATKGHCDMVAWLLEESAVPGPTSGDGTTPLHAAAENGHLLVAKQLYQAGVGIEVQSTDGYTPLHRAAQFGHLEIIKWLIQLKADVHCTSSEGWTPLHLAAESGHLAVAQYLHENGAVLDVQSKDGYTPLHRAALFGHLEFVKWLIQLKADVHCTSNEGWTPLYLAVVSGNLTMAKYLHENGAVLDVQSRDGYTPLHFTAQLGQLEIIKWLIQLKADVHCASSEGWTPLHLAVVSGNLTIAKYLHENGAVLDVQSRDGYTPLHHAAQFGHLEIIKWLIQLKADVHCTSSEGWTPLHLAAESGHLAVAQYLHENGTVLDVQSKDGYTPLHRAALFGHLEFVKWLIQLKADVHCTSNEGWTPLHLAAVSGNLTMAKYLHENGAVLDVQSRDGYTPLHHAAQFGHLEIIKWLIQLKADVHCTSSEGWTPLHLAAESGHLAVAQYLHENGAVLDVQSREGYTPLHRAALFGHLDFVKWLVTLQANLDALSTSEETPLHLATMQLQQATVRILLDNRASANLADNFGRTALHFAIYKGDAELIQMLLSRGADLDLRDGYGRSSQDWINLIPGLNVLLGSSCCNPDPFLVPDSTSILANSVYRLSTRLAELDGITVSPGFHELGHCLVYLQQLNDATTAFEQQIVSGSEPTEVTTHLVTCNVCNNGQNIEGDRFVCTTCPDVDLCSLCLDKYQSQQLPTGCCGHDFIKIPGPNWIGDACKVNTEGESRVAWLCRLSNLYLERQ